MTRIGTQQAGSAYVFALVMVVLLSGLSLSYLTRSLYVYELEKTDAESERAFRIAETGLRMALAEMEARTDAMVDGIGNFSGALEGGTFDVTLTPAFDPSDQGPYTLRSIGTYGRHRNGVEMVIAGGKGVFKHSMVAVEGMAGTGGALIDSYNSALGSYASQALNVGPGGRHYANANAKVLSNEDIKLTGSSAVYGDATPGPDGKIKVSGSAFVTGSTAQADALAEVDPFVYAPPIDVTTKKLRVKKDETLTLATGVYRFEQVDIKGELILDGEVTIFCDKSFKVAGTVDVLEDSSVVVNHGSDGKFDVKGVGILNRSQAPRRLRINDAGASSFVLGGTAGFHGVLYAPETSFVSKNGSEFFGAMVVRDIKMSGGTNSFHYDEALAGDENGSFGVVMVRNFRP